MYNHELTLIGYEKTEDDIGNEVLEEVKETVLCRITDIGQSEFYNANVSDLRPDIKFIIKEFEYKGQKEVIFNEVKYKVIRTYYTGIESGNRRTNTLKFDEIELTCERVIGHGS